MVWMTTSGFGNNLLGDTYGRVWRIYLAVTAYMNMLKPFFFQNLLFRVLHVPRTKRFQRFVRGTGPRHYC